MDASCCVLMKCVLRWWTYYLILSNLNYFGLTERMNTLLFWEVHSYSSDKILCLRFQALMAASMKFRVFWDVMPCSHTEVDQCFRGAYCLRWMVNESSPWWWRQYAPLKCRSTSTWLHGATSQKTLNFNFSICITVWCSFLCSQMPVTGPYHQPDDAIPSVHTLLIALWKLN
jgi:hypothetical protein